VLTETIIEVFSIMVGVDVSTFAGPTTGQTQVTGVIGIAGAMRANFLLQCTAAGATKLAAQMLGVSPEDPGSQKAACDAIGEVCNIVAGYFKAKIGLGDACMLSVPTIITGADYCFRSPNTFERLELTILFEGETLAATLEIAR
jgi:CheY-specific phosphatase CheX